MQTIREPTRSIPVVGEYDVVVAGGGPAGVTAAVAAARAGASTLLIERYGFLGGMATAGLVRPLLGVRARNSDQPVIGGIAEEKCRLMADLGAAVPFEQGIEVLVGAAFSQNDAVFRQLARPQCRCQVSDLAARQRRKERHPAQELRLHRVCPTGTENTRTCCVLPLISIRP